MTRWAETVLSFVNHDQLEEDNEMLSSVTFTMEIRNVRKQQLNWSPELLARSQQ